MSERAGEKRRVTHRVFVCAVYDIHGGAISLTASAGTDLFATFSSFDRQLHVFRAGEPAPVHSLVTPSEASALSFSADGAGLLVGLHSGAVLAYDLRQLREPREKTAPHAAAVRRFAFLGNSVISGLFPSFSFSLVLIHPPSHCSGRRPCGAHLGQRRGGAARGLCARPGRAGRRARHRLLGQDAPLD